MGASTFGHILRFIILVLAQGFLFNHLDLLGYINPYVYVMFILMLPIHINGIALLLLALITGLSVDLFTQTWGIHTAATLFMAYLRPGWLRLMAPRDGYTLNISPSISSMGIIWTSVYISSMVFTHHFTLFVMDIFRIDEIGNLLGRTVTSAFLTCALIILFQLSKGIKDRRE